MASKDNDRGPENAPDAPKRSAGASGAASRPDPEVLEKAKRRRFTSEFKLRIVAEAEACKEPGSIAALLRREGLYSSHLTEWRRACREGSLGALSKRRGPKEKNRSAATQELERLRKETARLKRRLQQAETILEIQKKASEILGIPLSPHELDEDA